jgi:signal transduction histidine kinase
VEEEGGHFLCRPLSLGQWHSLEEVVEMATDAKEKGPVLELHWALRVLSKARHDLNNPLTAGLAEVQLLLMDEHDPEVQESLETIQEQFRRLRDMVADLACLRPRRDPPPE